MSKIINFAKIIRRNWKKSTVLFGILTYGASYGIDKYRTFQMMRAYCEQAKAYGEQVLPDFAKPRHVTVILNPEANKRKSHIQFEKFAAPLLHLAGYKVSVIQTTVQKEAQKLMEIMSNTDAVIVAGGDGTLHEVVTGLLNRPDSETETLPLGIIPVGQTNTVAKHLYGSNSSSSAQLMAEAAMAVIREGTVSLDVMKVKIADGENPVYAMSSFEQGAFAEIEPKIQKYWYLGALKDRFAYFYNYFKDLDIAKLPHLQYVAPCTGCSQCYVPPKRQPGKWWTPFLPRPSHAQGIPDYRNITNEECGKIIPIEFLPTCINFSVLTSASDQKGKSDYGSLWIKMYPKDLSLKQFMQLGLNHKESKLHKSSDIISMINAREVKILNDDDSNNEPEPETSVKHCYIDKEKYKMSSSSCNITLIPKRVTVYA